MTLEQPPNLQVDLPLEKIASLCKQYGVQELSVFGSALREDFTTNSDVDFLVVFENGDAGSWACKYSELADELSALLARKVDVVSREAVEESENYLRRRHILQSAKTVYVA